DQTEGLRPAGDPIELVQLLLQGGKDGKPRQAGRLVAVLHREVVADLALGQDLRAVGGQVPRNVGKLPAHPDQVELELHPRRGLTIVEASVADDSGPAKAVWFNQPWLADRLREGMRVLLYGKLERSAFRVEAHEVGGADGAAGIHTTGLVPVHPASERLRPQ